MNKNHVFVTAEIGINHNGDLEIAKQLIDWAYLCGCDAVKFIQKNIWTVTENPHGELHRGRKKKDWNLRKKNTM